MRRGIITPVAVLALWGSIGLGAASAQNVLGQAPPRPRPTISPYLNIGGNAGAYYGIVKPQMEGNRAIYDLQQGGSRIQPDGWVRPQDQTTSALGGLQTGHQASFFNTSHFFPAGPPGGASSATSAGFGSGLGGYTPPSSNFGINQGGFGINQGGTRTFFGANMGQPLIR